MSLEKGAQKIDELIESDWNDFVTTQPFLQGLKEADKDMYEMLKYHFKSGWVMRAKQEKMND